MTPAYRDHLVTLYHGDALNVLPGLDVPIGGGVAITDPPWPDILARHKRKEGLIAGLDRAEELIAGSSLLLHRLARMLIVVFGCDTDPRKLSVPASWKFYRATWLRMIPPRYRGTLLAGSDVAYCFGQPRLGPGGKRRVIPGEFTGNSTGRNRPKSPHPCPRNDRSMEFLVRQYSVPGETIYDPFSGSGTTLVAAARAGRPSVGIEIDERWIDLTIRRIRSET